MSRSPGNGNTTALNVEEAVRSRYAEGAQDQQKELCCPVNYDPKFLKVIPAEIIERDYGCGDPSKYLKEGETVLDLGSGGGKICYIASQVVGPKGKIIGVDYNPEMLALAEKYKKEIGDKIGYHNVEFRRGKIQNLKLNFGLIEKFLSSKSIRSYEDYLALDEYEDKIANDSPLIEDDSVDVIVSNCVLNLVRTDDKAAMFKEMHRALKRGGRVAISDIVSDEDIPLELQNDPELWSGCVSGAFREDLFLKAFEEAGFYGVEIAEWDEKPFQVVKGIEFRSITVTAYKGKEGACLERNQAVIYNGPWKQVLDDDNHILKRGVRSAVCDKTFHIFSKAPYQEDVTLISPQKEIPLSEAQEFDCRRSDVRSPKETKGAQYTKTESPSSDCGPTNCC